MGCKACKGAQREDPPPFGATGGEEQPLLIKPATCDSDQKDNCPNYWSNGCIPCGLKMLGGLLLYVIIGLAVYMPVEGWNFTDAVYFVVVTLTTVGYGDLLPTTTIAKIFTCFYVFGGLLFVATLLSTAIESIFVQQERILSELNDDDTDSGTPLGQVAKGRQHSHCSDRPKRLFLALGLIVLMVVLGMLIFMYCDGLTVLDAFYASCISVTTVGYGDHPIHGKPGRIWAIFWLLVSTVTVAHALGIVLEVSLEAHQERVAKRIFNQALSQAEQRAADTSGDGKISEAEYIVHKLVQADAGGELTQTIKELRQAYKASGHGTQGQGD